MQDLRPTEPTGTHTHEHWNPYPKSGYEISAGMGVGWARVTHG
jgi:hypothetical protein